MNILISRYSSHPGYAGQLLLDEPGKSLFDTMNAFIEGYKKAYPEKIPYVNMLPSYATGGICTTSYDDYISAWLDKTSMTFFSYDHYPLLESGDETTDYYYNLSVIRDKQL